MPNRLKIIRGETRPSRVNYDEPMPTALHLQVPEDLSADAREIWVTIVQAVHHTGVLTSADVDTLRMYCEAFVRYRLAEDMLTKTGPLIKGRNGEFVKNPLHQIVRDNALLVRALGRELGLTPAARSGLRGDLDAQANSAGAKLDALISAARRTR